MPASKAFSRSFKSDALGMKTLTEIEQAIHAKALRVAQPANPYGSFQDLTMLLGNLRDMPWSFEQRKDRFTVSLGYGDGEPIHFSPSPFPSPPLSLEDRELQSFARQLGVSFQEGIEPKKVIDDYLKTHPESVKK